jgi:ABC-type nitrate/sulfonate/bicarbonate transport system permease component
MVVTRTTRTVAVLAWAFALLALWEVLTRLQQSIYMPPPSTIVQQLQADWFSGPAGQLFFADRWFEDGFVSIGRLLTGWGIAVLVGAPIGILLGLQLKARHLMLPTMRFVGSVPPPALLPLALILFGVGPFREISVIALGCIWPILLASMAGVGSIEAVSSDAAKLLRLSRVGYAKKILLPAVMPALANGMRISLSFAVVLMVVSELFVASSGLGYALVEAQRTFRLLSMWAVVVLISLIGVLANALLEFVLRRVLLWHHAMAVRA